MPANTVTTYTTVGNREDLIDSVFMISPTDTPFTSAIAKSTAKLTYHEWQTDSLAAPSATNAAVEGADASYAAQTPTVRLGNYTQILTKTYSVSNTQDAVVKAGPNEIARLGAKKSAELKKDIEAAALTNGVSTIGSGSVARTMKGVKGFIVSNFFGGTGSAAPVAGNPGTAPVAGTNRAYAETLLKPAILAAYQAGGEMEGGMVLLRPADKQIMSGFGGNVTRFQDVNGGSAQVLNTSYSIYGSDYGNLKIVPNRVMGSVSDNAVYVIDTTKWALATLRAFDNKELAQTGDARNFQMIYEGTLEARSESSSAQIRDLS